MFRLQSAQTQDSADGGVESSIRLQWMRLSDDSGKSIHGVVAAPSPIIDVAWRERIRLAPSSSAARSQNKSSGTKQFDANHGRLDD
jgi:hypothetical protein